MDIYSELSNALSDGFKMMEILKQAKAAGHKRGDAREALQKLFDEASADGRETDEEMIVDMMDLVNNYGNSDGWIWEYRDP